MNVLLVYPEHPRATYWSFSESLCVVGKRASMPPLGLVTIAAQLPADADVRLVDMNIGPLLDVDLRWADVVLTSTMIVQEDALLSVIARAKAKGVPVICGGPHPSSAVDRLSKVADAVVAGEAEGLIGRVFEDLRSGELRNVYRAEGFPDIRDVPVPRFDLLCMEAYHSMAVQYSRGCPFRCEFCDIWKLYGRRPRVKQPPQLLAEIQVLYDLGWRGSTFIVDDNFIGNPREVKRLLAELAEWQQARNYPLDLYTECSVNLAQDPELLSAMRAAGFTMVFLGIESPALASLECSNKVQNTRLDLVAAVHTIQSYGIEVSGGFIVGFDSDTPNIFLAQKEFIGRAGIPLAMVGMLTALPGTELELRLQREGRMNCRSIGNNTHRFEPNFTPRMPVEDLKRGYKQLLLDLYGPRLRHYFGRCRELLRRIGPRAYASRSITPADWVALVRTLWLGVRRRARWSFAAFLAWAILRVPRRFPDAVRLGAMGLHLEAITRGAVAVEDLRGFLATARAGIDALATACAGAPGAWHRAEALMHVRQIRRAAARQARRILRRVPASFRSEATQTYLEFLADVDRLVPEMHWPLRDPRELIEDLRRWLAAKECEIERAVGEAWAAVGHGAAAAKTTVRNAAAQRRAVLAEATRRARRLPTEYRIVARNEIDRWRDRWLDLVAVAPSRAVA